MKKKILAVLLVLCAVVLFALTASAATDTSVGYRVNVTNAIKLTKNRLNGKSP